MRNVAAFAEFSAHLEETHWFYREKIRHTSFEKQARFIPCVKLKVLPASSPWSALPSFTLSTVWCSPFNSAFSAWVGARPLFKAIEFGSVAKYKKTHDKEIELLHWSSFKLSLIQIWREKWKNKGFLQHFWNRILKAGYYFWVQFQRCTKV